MCERSEQPGVTSCGATRETQPDFFHEETQYDGTAQSSVNDVIPRQFTGATRCHLSTKRKATAIYHENRSNRIGIVCRIKIVNRVNDQVGKRQRIISNVTGDGEEHSLTW